VSRPGRAREPIPIACTLDAESVAARSGEWRRFVASSVVAVETDTTTIGLVLRDSDAALVAAASLGAREKACCAFFDIGIEILPGRRTLRFSVPAGAEEALATFLELIRP
jgi:hypothetical protein